MLMALSLQVCTVWHAPGDKNQLVSGGLRLCGDLDVVHGVAAVTIRQKFAEVLKRCILSSFLLNHNCLLIVRDLEDDKLRECGEGVALTMHKSYNGIISHSHIGRGRRGGGIVDNTAEEAHMEILHHSPAIGGLCSVMA